MQNCHGGAAMACHHFNVVSQLLSIFRDSELIPRLPHGCYVGVEAESLGQVAADFATRRSSGFCACEAPGEGQAIMAHLEVQWQNWLHRLQELP